MKKLILAPHFFKTAAFAYRKFSGTFRILLGTAKYIQFCQVSALIYFFPPAVMANFLALFEVLKYMKRRLECFINVPKRSRSVLKCSKSTLEYSRSVKNFGSIRECFINNRKCSLKVALNVLKLFFNILKCN